MTLRSLTPKIYYTFTSLHAFSGQPLKTIRSDSLADAAHSWIDAWFNVTQVFRA